LSFHSCLHEFPVLLLMLVFTALIGVPIGGASLTPTPTADLSQQERVSGPREAWSKNGLGVRGPSLNRSLVKSPTLRIYHGDKRCVDQTPRKSWRFSKVGKSRSSLHPLLTNPFPKIGTHPVLQSSSGGILVYHAKVRTD
jgi:hypothetical protein